MNRRYKVKYHKVRPYELKRMTVASLKKQWDKVYPFVIEHDQKMVALFEEVHNREIFKKAWIYASHRRLCFEVISPDRR